MNNIIFLRNKGLTYRVFGFYKILLIFQPIFKKKAIFILLLELYMLKFNRYATKKPIYICPRYQVKGRAVGISGLTGHEIELKLPSRDINFPLKPFCFYSENKMQIFHLLSVNCPSYKIDCVFSIIDKYTITNRTFFKIINSQQLNPTTTK